VLDFNVRKSFVAKDRATNGYGQTKYSWGVFKLMLVMPGYNTFRTNTKHRRALLVFGITLNLEQGKDQNVLKSLGVGRRCQEENYDLLFFIYRFKLGYSLKGISVSLNLAITLCYKFSNLFKI